MSPMRMLFLLTVTGTTGSILFATDPAGPGTQDRSAATSAPAATAMQQSAEKEDDAALEKAAAAAVDDAAEEKDPASDTDEKQAAAATADQDVDPAPPAKSDADGGSSPQRFVPSEQVRADFDVSFPVDI